MLIKDLFGNIKKEVFRLELLDYYDKDREEFQKFKNGNIFIDSETKQFCKTIRQFVGEGKRIVRIHVIPETLTEYLNFEIKTGYLPQLNAGAEIYLISREKYKQLLQQDFNPDDFFVFDNHTIVYSLTEIVSNIQVISLPPNNPRHFFSELCNIFW